MKKILVAGFIVVSTITAQTLDAISPSHYTTHAKELKTDVKIPKKQELSIQDAVASVVVGCACASLFNCYSCFEQIDFKEVQSDGI